MSTHTCPHDGEDWTDQSAEEDRPLQLCGENGWLCDMCKRDADRESTDRLVEAILGKVASNE